MNLKDLSKDALVEVARIALGKVGDSARTPKPEYIRMLSEHAEADAINAQRVEAAVAHVAANGVPMRAFARQPLNGDPVATLEALRAGLSALGIGAQLDEERVRELIAAELDVALARIAPRTITHIIHGPQTVELDEHMHPAFLETLDAVAAGLNVLLVGPAGCGKSHMAAQIARALGRDFGTLHCSAGASESQLLGWLLPIREGGAFEYVPSEFARLYAKGNAVYLLDEIDAADPNMLMVINGALANGHLHVPMRHQEPVIARGPDMAIIAAANTFGTGADMLYSGRNQLDAATLDRFYTIPMDYDLQLEASMVGGILIPQAESFRLAERRPQEIIPADCAELAVWVHAVRAKVAELRLRRVVSTRTLQKGLAMLRTGYYTQQHVRSRLLAGWTRDELAKLGSLAA